MADARVSTGCPAELRRSAVAGTCRAGGNGAGRTWPVAGRYGFRGGQPGAARRIPSGFGRGIRQARRGGAEDTGETGRRRAYPHAIDGACPVWRATARPGTAEGMEVLPQGPRKGQGALLPHLGRSIHDLFARTGLARRPAAGQQRAAGGGSLQPVAFGVRRLRRHFRKARTPLRSALAPGHDGPGAQVPAPGARPGR